MTQTDIEGKHNFEIILQWQKTKLEESRKELKDLKKPLFKKMTVIQTSPPVLPGVLDEDPKLATSKNTYDLKKVKPKKKTSVIYKPTRKEVSNILDRISTLQDDLLLHVSRTELLRSLDVISISESNRRLCSLLITKQQESEVITCFSFLISEVIIFTLPNIVLLTPTQHNAPKSGFLSIL